MSEITISREVFIGELHEVKYWHDGKSLGFLQTPGEILRALHAVGNALDVHFVHFVGGGRPTRTFRLPRKRPGGRG